MTGNPWWQIWIPFASSTVSLLIGVGVCWSKFVAPWFKEQFDELNQGRDQRITAVEHTLTDQNAVLAGVAAALVDIQSDIAPTNGDKRSISRRLDALKHDMADRDFASVLHRLDALEAK